MAVYRSDEVRKVECGVATNLEIKVRCDAGELKHIKERMIASGAEIEEPMLQRDTYFVVAEGRLKLREVTRNVGRDMIELIGYVRPDLEGSRWSQYWRVELEHEQADGIRDALAATCGVAVVVEKRREVGLSDRTRIHLDDVAVLGTFVELETVTDSANDATAIEELNQVVQRLGLDRSRAVAGSYADLIRRER